MGCDGGPGRGSWRVHGSLASDRHVGPNKGWASVGVNHDTAAFPVNTIHRRWRNMGQRIYARADSLLITADGGGALACGCVCGNGNCRNSTIVNLISATRTRKGLTVRCVLDRKKYPKKIKVTDEQMQSLRLTPDRFHGDWNYTIRPRLK